MDKHKERYLIGLTGGIGSGKSTVSDYLRTRGCTILDADAIGHEITQKGSPLLAELAQIFGSEVLDEEGCLLRKKLADIVFSDPAKKQELDDFFWTKISEIIRQRAATSETKLTIVDAPLLLEAGWHRWVDEVWLVTADIDIRVKRTVARDNSSEQAVRDRIANQWQDSEKAKMADRVIDNSGTVEMLYHKIEEILSTYDKQER